MDSRLEDVVLVRAHERKLREAVGVLEQVRHHVFDAARELRDSSQALHRQAAQAGRRSRDLVADAARLTAVAEQLIADARAIQGERTSCPIVG